MNLREALFCGGLAASEVLGVGIAANLVAASIQSQDITFAQSDQIAADASDELERLQQVQSRNIRFSGGLRVSEKADCSSGIVTVLLDTIKILTDSPIAVKLISRKEGEADQAGVLAFGWSKDISLRMEGVAFLKRSSENEAGSISLTPDRYREYQLIKADYQPLSLSIMVKGSPLATTVFGYNCDSESN